jgi:hypothetical protein
LIWQCNSFSFYRCANPTIQRKSCPCSLFFCTVILFFPIQRERERETERERERERERDGLGLGERQREGLGPCLHLKTCHESTGIPGCTLITLELTLVGPQQVPLIYVSLFHTFFCSKVWNACIWMDVVEKLIFKFLGAAERVTVSHWIEDNTILYWLLKSNCCDMFSFKIVSWSNWFSTQQLDTIYISR